MRLLRSIASFCLVLCSLATIGCGGRNCQISGLTVTPSTATVNHASAAPGNSQIFNAEFQGSACGGPAGAAINPVAHWTASDPSVQLSSNLGNQVTATCTTALATAVTITATGVGFTSQALLTCN